MRMLKPSPGELVDRQTILELKIEHSNVEFEGQQDSIHTDKKTNAVDRVMTRTVVNKGAKDTRVHLFFDELELISNHLKEKWVIDIMNSETKIAAYDRLYEELSEVNSNLWDLEDQIRILRDAPDKFEELAAKRAAEIAYTIADLNDRRAEIVRQFNGLWGMDIKEKLHT